MMALGMAGGVAAAATLGNTASASGSKLHAQKYDWKHENWFTSLDSASLRRGYEVYRQICSTCHSMELLSFRHLVGVTHTEDQAKMLAGTYTIMDGPNDKGEMFERPRKVNDAFPSPYPNTEYAQFINGGANPPDLSCVLKAREGHEDYIFALLTGYRPAPAGIEMREGLHYNPYFEGGAISMAQALQDGLMDYEDGTPATASQMAKDVTVFLKWAGEPEHDERKLMGAKLIGLFSLGLLASLWHKRFKWNSHKSRKIRFLY